MSKVSTEEVVKELKRSHPALYDTIVAVADERQRKPKIPKKKLSEMRRRWERLSKETKVSCTYDGLFVITATCEISCGEAEVRWSPDDVELNLVKGKKVTREMMSRLLNLIHSSVLDFDTEWSIELQSTVENSEEFKQFESKVEDWFEDIDLLEHKYPGFDGGEIYLND